MLHLHGDTDRVQGLPLCRQQGKTELQCNAAIPHPSVDHAFPPWPPQNLTESMSASLPKHDEEDEDMREKEVQMESLICAFETLGKAWPRSPETQRKSANGVQTKLSWLKLFPLKMERGKSE